MVIFCACTARFVSDLKHIDGFLTRPLKMFGLVVATFSGSCFGMSHNCSQLCTPVRDSFLCLCFHGYSLARDGRTCLDVDECTEYRPCHQICRNTEGGFECACHEGYGLNSTSGECVGENNR